MLISKNILKIIRKVHFNMILIHQNELTDKLHFSILKVLLTYFSLYHVHNNQ